MKLLHDLFSGEEIRLQLYRSLLGQLFIKLVGSKGSGGLVVCTVNSQYFPAFSSSGKFEYQEPNSSWFLFPCASRTPGYSVAQFFGTKRSILGPGSGGISTLVGAGLLAFNLNSNYVIASSHW